MKTYLISGGCGFIGSAFIRYLLHHQENIQIINLDKLTYAANLNNLTSVADDKRYTFVHGDINDENLLNELFTQYSIDTIVNFAAESHVDRSIASSDEFVKTNVMGCVTLMNVAKKYWSDKGDKRFLQMSTDEVYGSSIEGYFKESDSLHPSSPYSASKASADLFALSFASTYQFPVIIVRSCNNFGPYQYPEKLIPLMIKNYLENKELPVYGNGLNVREWIYVEDTCQAIDLVLQKGQLHEIYNIGSGYECSNLKMIETILNQLSLIPSSSKITYVEDRLGHDWRYALDCDKLYKLGFKCETSFEEGMKQTVQWYVENQNWLKNSQDE